MQQESELGQLFEYLALVTHLEHFLKGLINSSDLVYYLSFIIFGLFLTHRVLESSQMEIT